MFRFLLVLNSVLLLGGCLKKPEADVTVIWFKATCKLQDAGSANLACIKYRNEYAGDPSADCDLLDTTYNAFTKSYVYQQQECPSANVTGICEVDKKRVYYYQTLFNSTNANQECINRGGTPQPM